MKIKITFNLPDENNEYLCATHGFVFHSSLYAISDLIRNKLKYDDVSDETEKILNDITTIINNTNGYWEIE